MNQEEVHINEIQELVKFVFSDNRDNNRMIIESSDFKDNRDLYFFCIELTMKGLSYLYGNDKGTVDIDELSLDKIENIKNKLGNAAIELLLDIDEIENSNTENTEIIYDIPYKDLEKKVNLEDYALKIIKKNMKYTLRFKIMDYF